MEMFLGRRLIIRTRVDNTQAISAAKKGYSKRLRYLQRTHRVSIGAIHDLLEDAEQKVVVEHVESACQKGDMFTKPLPPGPFADARNRIGMIAPSEDGARTSR